MQAIAVGDKHQAVDFRRVGVAAAYRAFLVDFVHQHGHGLPDAGGQAAGADFGLQLHQARLAVFFYFFWHRVGQRVGGGAVHRRIGETAHPIQLGFAQEVQQDIEVFFGFAGEANDKGAADHQLRADFPPFADALQHIVGVGRAFHRFQHFL